MQHDDEITIKEMFRRIPEMILSWMILISIVSGLMKIWHFYSY